MLGAAIVALAASAPSAPAATGGLEAGESLITASPALVGAPMRFTGTLGPAGANRLIEIQLQSAGGPWTRVATVQGGGDGSFTTTWQAAQTGQYVVRAVPGGGAVAAQAAQPPTAVAVVYRRATATWYDQSGSRGACGVRLRRRTLGVAHKTLPCGTIVEITYRGHTVQAPVVDRGPYSRGVSYDLTIAVARSLRMVSAGRVRVGVLPATERTPKTPLSAVAPASVGGGAAVPGA